MRNLNQDNITQAVIASFADTATPRLQQIMTSLVQHLHAFARDVKLTEEEWFQGIEFLTQCGHITHPDLPSRLMELIAIGIGKGCQPSFFAAGASMDASRL